ncbi:glycosyltransferase [Salinisphaera sp.]|uniref:glycosyltransferase n=1 Tax=Salinisphaera sp. TaxID=1914330 RepID=UPI002D7894F0|nr:glycosyltransferase [Salinisphaera sp.]HET7313719.1 glycosyltransferase [Salinisphaera sp.]
MRHVLMVAFHYPPLAGSPGALRARAFVSYLPRSGWQPHVLAPCTRAYAETECEAAVPPEGSIHRSWALDARRHLGWRGRYPELAAVPDRWASWAPSAVIAGLSIIRRYPIEAIWSTYPIATSHLIAATLARLSGLPWVAEFRDPVAPEASPRMQCWAQRAIERRAIKGATRSVFVTPGALADCRSRFGDFGDRFALIPNGYDDALEPVYATEEASRRPNDPVRLVHSGHLYRHGRNPDALLKAVALLKAQGRIDAGRLRIIFRNSQEDAFYQRQIDDLNLSDIISLEPRIPHAQALREQRSANGLLLLQGPEFNRQIPAKLFEYLRARKPVLALVDNGGDTAALLDELGGALRVASDDAERIAEALSMFVHELYDGRHADTGRWAVDEMALARFSRARQTETLAALLCQATAAGKAD